MPDPMLFEIIITTITLMVLGAASLIDLKTREVPDMLSYGFLFAALGIRAIFAFEEGFFFFLSGLLGLVASFVLAFILYRTHQWGGADSKLLLGMGVVIGISYPLHQQSFTLALFILALLFAGALYGFVWMIVLALRNKMHRTKLMQGIRKELQTYSKARYGVWIITALFALVAFFIPPLFILAPFPLLIFYLFVFVSVVEHEFFIKRYPVDRLVEGDWLAEPVMKGGKTVVDTRTLEKEDIHKIRAAQVEHVTIREGIPFVPSFLFAYIIIVFGKEMVSAVLHVFL